MSGALDLTLTTTVPGPIERSGRTSAWAFLRRTAEHHLGRCRLWSWFWAREFNSLMADRTRADRKAGR